MGGFALGADGCREGWVGVLLDPDGHCADVLLTATIANLVAAVGEARRLEAIGIDIPIGLPDSTTRPVDEAARRMLSGAASSVFPTPTREALLAPTYAEASARNRTLTGKGISRQSFALKEKILDVDGWLAHSRPSVPVIEVHPELSFRTMAGRPLGFNKRSWTGVQRRLRLLEQFDIDIPAEHAAGRVGVDDVFDAAAAAWTAHRYARGLAAPVLISDDELIGQIWY